MFKLLRTATRQARQATFRETSRGFNIAPAVTVSASESGEDFRRLALITAAAAVGLAIVGNNRANSCGIVGVVGHDNAKEVLLEGLAILKNRGYDSVGLSTVSDSQQLVTTKFASVGAADGLDLLTKHAETHSGHRAGIGHTRWATHGGKTDQNAHPHHDTKDRVAVVHNGTITNAYELRSELTSAGLTFRSETDTEVIAMLIGQFLDQGLDTKAALHATLKRLQGTWGLCVVDKTDPNTILVARNGSPLVIGVGNGCTYVASETTAFNRHTKSFIALRDGEVATLRANGTDLDVQRVELAPDQDVKLSPAPFAHWTLRELMEQPQSLAQALGFGGRMNGQCVVLGGLDTNRDRFMSVQNLLISACGTSLHAGMYGAKIMRELGSFNTVTTADAAETQTQTFPMREGGLLVISQSGETKDVHRALLAGVELGIPCFSAVNSVGSLIARTASAGVYLNAGRENGVASTKAFSAQVTVLALIACWFSQNRPHSPQHQEKREQLLESLQRLPISFGMALRLNDQCKQIARQLVGKRDMFVLGKGYGEAVALEGALKIKEIAYIHAEGYSGGALKHGPFALIDGEGGENGPTPIVMLVLDDEHATHMRTAAHEVKARGAKVIAITDNPSLVHGLADEVVQIPSNGPLTALLAVLPLQMLAYHLAVLKGIDPDVPRNLAKAVTVD